MNVFEKLAQGRPAPAEEAAKQPRDELAAAQKLLDFLQRWTKDAITERQIRIFGPGTLRNHASVTQTTEILVDNGWLIPLEAPPRGGRAWGIVHKPVVRPSVAAGVAVAGAVAADVAE